MDFKNPDRELLKFWEQASYLYQDQMSEKCLTYLIGRGLKPETIEYFRLGYIETPLTGHEHLTGRVVIPYIKKLAVVALKFRCIEDHNCKEEGHAKYLSEGSQWLYNTNDLLQGEYCDIAEGEFDTHIAHQSGRYCVGIPGVESWKANPHWRSLLRPPLSGLVWADNDSSKQQNYGHNLGKKVTKELPRYKMVTLPNDCDTTDTYLKLGKEGLLACGGISRTSHSINT